MFIIEALASGGGGGRGSQNRAGSGNNYTRGSQFQRRGNETMTNYYRRMANTPGSGVRFGQTGRMQARGNGFLPNQRYPG